MIVVSQLHLPLELQLLIWSHGVIPLWQPAISKHVVLCYKVYTDHR